MQAGSLKLPRAYRRPICFSAAFRAAERHCRAIYSITTPPLKVAGSHDDAARHDTPNFLVERLPKASLTYKSACAFHARPRRDRDADFLAIFRNE